MINTHPLIQTCISDDESQLPAVVFHHAAFNAFRTAYDLSRASLELSGLSAIPNREMSDDKNLQRQAIFSIAYKMLNAERDRAMDIAVKHWIKYRTMEPASE